MGKTKKKQWSYIGMLAGSFLLAAGAWSMGFIRLQPPKVGTEAEFQEREERAGILVWLEKSLNREMEEKEPVSGREKEEDKQELWKNIESILTGKKGRKDTEESSERKEEAGSIDTEDSMEGKDGAGNIDVEDSFKGKDKTGDRDGVGNFKGNDETKDLDVPKSFYTADISYFDDALFIGDSRTVGLQEYGELGNAKVIADSGMSVYRVMKDSFKLESGEEMTLEELLYSQKFGKAYVMLGINELGYDFDQTVKKYGSMIEMIQQLQPGILVFVQANLHISGEKAEGSEIYNNENINRFNEAVSQIADGKEIFYLDVNELFDDENGNLSMEYTTDHAHILGKYYIDWAQWILEHAVEG